MAFTSKRKIEEEMARQATEAGEAPNSAELMPARSIMSRVKDRATRALGAVLLTTTVTGATACDTIDNAAEIALDGVQGALANDGAEGAYRTRKAAIEMQNIVNRFSIQVDPSDELMMGLYNELQGILANDQETNDQNLHLLPNSYVASMENAREIGREFGLNSRQIARVAHSISILSTGSRTGNQLLPYQVDPAEAIKVVPILDDFFARLGQMNPSEQRVADALAAFVHTGDTGYFIIDGTDISTIEPSAFTEQSFGRAVADALRKDSNFAAEVSDIADLLVNGAR